MAKAAAAPTNSRERDRLCLILIAAIVLAGLALVAYGYWPGIMIDDARWQYQQAVDNAYEDWHPPLMAWIWRRLMFLQPGPAPMLLLQLLLYWGGIALIALWAYRRAPRMSVAIAFAGLIPAPLALLGAVTKDCLMAGALTCATGLVFEAGEASSPVRRSIVSVAALIALLFAAALRFNAFLACVPLALAALPRSFTSTALRSAATALAASAIFLAAGPAVSTLVQAENTKVNLSLILFDLGGITERSGKSAFPDMGVRNPVAVNRECYDPKQWDGYSSWAKTPCPLGFDRFETLVDDDDVSPISFWLHAIADHPLAYAEHRLDHFNQSTFFLVRSGPEFTAWTASVPNPWNFQVRRNPALRAVSAYADLAARTPFGWPCFWIALGLAAFVTAVSTGMDRKLVAIAASAPLYGLGYLVFGVATGMRYHVWTITGAALGAALVFGEILRTGTRVRKGWLFVAAGIVALPTCIAIASRLIL